MLQRTGSQLTLLVASSLWVCASMAQADTPLLDALFVEHAVLQRDRPIDVSGRAQPGDEVSVTLAGASASGRADDAGRWAVRLPAQVAGGPHALTARAGTRTQSVNDVLIGDVWLCSGQSNMEWPVRSTHDAYNEAALSANPRIRHVTIPRVTSAAARTGFDSALEWKVAGPGNTEHFSAVCYYFVRELQKSVDVPHGIINASWGGSRIEPWMSDAALRQQPGYLPPSGTGAIPGRNGGRRSRPRAEKSPGSRPALMTAPGARRPRRSGTGRPGACPRSRGMTAWCGFARA
jgi:sialate O-acetylesterase